MQDLNALGPRLQLDLLRDWPKLNELDNSS